MIKHRVLLLSFIFLIQSCFSFKSEYPEIKFYYLTQEPFSFRTIAKMDIGIVCNDFDFPYEVISTNQLQIKFSGNYIKKYYYHRWAVTPDRMIMDFIVQRLNLSNSFVGGVTKISAMNYPQYILNGQVLDFSAYNLAEKSEENYVNISIRIWVVKLEPSSSDKKIIFENTYMFKQARTNSSIGSIPPAFSKALSNLVDKMIFDLQSSLVEDTL